MVDPAQRTKKATLSEFRHDMALQVWGPEWRKLPLVRFGFAHAGAAGGNRFAGEKIGSKVYAEQVLWESL